MKLKKVIAISLALCFALSMCTTAFAAETSIPTYKVLDVPHYAQEKSNWCWAACTLMVTNFVYNSNKDQGDIVTFIKGSEVNEYGSVWNIVDAIEWATLLNYDAATNYPFPISFNALSIRIANGRPLVSLCSNGIGDIGHFVVVCGYNTTTEQIYIINPSSGTGRWLSFSSFESGSWTTVGPHSGDVYFNN